MQGFLIRAAVVAIGLWLASQIVPGIEFNSTESLIAAALLLGIINAFVRPILIILTLPITLLTLGLFLLVINGLMIELVSALLSGFVVTGFWPAVGASIVVSLTSWVMSGWIGGGGHDRGGRIDTITMRQTAPGRWE
jgi:putative membrane protein